MRFTSLLALALSLGTGSMAQAAAEKIATLEVSLDDANLIKKNTGIRTLFIILYDADNPMPRPYGAMKVDLKADASGSIYKGDLTTENVQAMAGGPVPKNLKIKARLDKDGSAGKDQAGDLVGTQEKVKAGDATKIVINTAI